MTFVTHFQNEFKRPAGEVCCLSGGPLPVTLDGKDVVDSILIERA
jgi:hypothetical protein